MSLQEGTASATDTGPATEGVPSGAIVKKKVAVQTPPLAGAITNNDTNGGTTVVKKKTGTKATKTPAAASKPAVAKKPAAASKPAVAKKPAAASSNGGSGAKTSKDKITAAKSLTKGQAVTYHGRDAKLDGKAGKIISIDSSGGVLVKFGDVNKLCSPFSFMAKAKK
jgi:hypothetical protein